MAIRPFAVNLTFVQPGGSVEEFAAEKARRERFFRDGGEAPNGYEWARTKRGRELRRIDSQAIPRKKLRDVCQPITSGLMRDREA